MGWTVRNVLIQLLNIVLGIVAIFIGLRFAFELLLANSSTPFVAWVYRVSETLIYPFRGIFPNQVFDGGQVFDTVALIAILAYALITYLVIYAIDAILSAGSYRSRYPVVG